MLRREKDRNGYAGLVGITTFCAALRYRGGHIVVSCVLALTVWSV